MKEKKKHRIYAIRLTEDVEESINTVMEHTNIQDIANTIRYCISFTKSKLIPEYIATKKTTKRVVYDNPMDRVEAQLAKKKEEAEAKRALSIKRGMEICELLDGEIVTQEGGFTACKYTTYDKVGSRVLTGSRTVPIEDLNDGHIEAQFKGGTKKETLKALNK